MPSKRLTAEDITTICAVDPTVKEVPQYVVDAVQSMKGEGFTYFPEFDALAHIKGPRPLLLQIDSANRAYHGMIELNRERHQAYADKQGYEYRVDPVPTDTAQWFRIKAIQKALNEGYMHVFYLDADTAVADFEADMRDAVKDPIWLGMTVHPYGFGSNAQWHFNTGVIYVRNCDASKEYIQGVLSAYCDELPNGKARYSWDQEPMNDLLLFEDNYQGGYRNLPQKWNQNIDHPSNPEHGPIVAAWHGFHTPYVRLKYMEEWSAKNPYPGQDEEVAVCA